jgi:hypothetical protein
MTSKTADRAAALALAFIAEDDPVRARELIEASADAFIALTRERTALREAGFDPDAPDGTAH